MKKLFLWGCIVLSFKSLQAQDNSKIWYDKPASEWVEALPVGNGQIGAMVFGGVEDELIQLNESTLWSGGPRKNNVNPEAYKYLKPIREALSRKDYSSAQELTRKMQGHYSESFLPLGDLKIRQKFKSGGKPWKYYRDLDISNAIASVSYEKDGVKFTREVLASRPDQVLVVKITANKPKSIFLEVDLVSQLRPVISTNGSDQLVMQAKAPARVDPSYYNQQGREPIAWEDVSGCNGMRVRTLLKAIPTQGEVSVVDNHLQITAATEVVLYLSAATSFNGFDRCPDKDGLDEKAMALNRLNAALAKPYRDLREDHIAAYRNFFNRVVFELNNSVNANVNSKIPSDLRLKFYSYGNEDPKLEEFFFQYGRYLLISASDPEGSPANLQGIWNKELRAPWSSNYTININTQMNYWPAESGNLSELHQPLLQFIDNLSKTGSLTAKEYYRARGWVAHHNSDIWALSNAVGDLGGGDPLWANWYMGGAWLSQHLWEHYAFTRDKKFLKERAYPIMKDAALFCVDWLIERDGYLITSPSTTPENVFWYKGKQVSVSEATTMDMAIIRDLFTNVIEAAYTIGEDRKFANQLSQKLAKLYPYRIGKNGQLQEWTEDYEEVDPHHRHLSHLFGLHPGRSISPLTTPELAKAAEKTFELRGDEGTGWSKGWKINFAARLLDGDHAYKMIREILKYCEPKDQGAGGTYPNFFDAHPPFQIDGNFGATAGYIEMLLQSHLNELHLLPALPSTWSSGRVSGLKGRGNFEVDLTWKDKKITNGKITSFMGNHCRLRSLTPLAIEGAEVQSSHEGIYFIYSFKTEKGGEYHLSAYTN